MPSDVDICNLGLVQLGARRINSLGDNSKEAREANAIYALQRDAEMESHLWKFACKVTALAALVAPPANTLYSTAYQLPVDFLRLEVAGLLYPGASFTDYRNGKDADYEIDGNQIYANFMGSLQPLPAGSTSVPQGPLPIRYVQRVTDTTTYPPTFVQALGMRMAMALAETLTQSTAKAQAAASAYGMAISMAIKINSIQRPPDAVADSPWVLSRI